MSPEERQLLSGLFERIGNSANTPRDGEAETYILEEIRRLPYAPYLLSQTVIVQDQALRAANEKLQALQAQVEDLTRKVQTQQQAPTGSGSFLNGIGSLFGGASQPSPPQRPPQQASNAWGQPQQSYGQPQYAPPPQPQGGPWGGAPQQGGWGGQPQGGFGSGMSMPGQSGGFLKGALGAAAGVAGGVLLADSIKGLFGGHNNGLGIGSGFGGEGISSGLGGGGGETIVNNYYENADPSVAQPDPQQFADQDQNDYQDTADYSSSGPGFDDTQDV